MWEEKRTLRKEDAKCTTVQADSMEELLEKIRRIGLMQKHRMQINHVPNFMEEYITLKALLNVAGINLTELDKIG